MCFFMLFNQNMLSFELLDIFSLSRKKETITTVKKNCHILSYRLEGSTEFYFKNKKHTVSKDDLIFIPIASSYSQHTENEELIVIHLNIHNYVGTNMSIVNCAKNPKIREYFLLLLELWNTSPDNYYKCMGVFYNLIDEGFSFSGYSSSIDKRLKLGLETIEKNAYRSDFSITEAEKISGYSEVYLRKLFKLHFNDTPINHLNTMRINRSLSLLKSGYYSINEVSSLVGYSDASYFAMVFKKTIGCTPTEYIKRHYRDM